MSCIRCCLLQRYEAMFKRNEDSGSFYLQSKIYRLVASISPQRCFAGGL